MESMGRNRNKKDDREQKIRANRYQIVRHIEKYTSEFRQNGRSALSKFGYINCTINMLHVYVFKKTFHLSKSEIFAQLRNDTVNALSEGDGSQKRLHLTIITGTGHLTLGQVF